MQAREMQLLGMVGNPDEDVFPLVWDSESRYDGFYRVLDASWAWVNDGSSRASVANWSITLEAIADYSSPVMETTTNTVLRTNSHGLAGTPSMFRTWDAMGNPVTSAQRTTAEGALMRSITLAIGQESWRFNASPADFYDGSVWIETQGADSAWYKITGTQVQATNSESWRVNNGLVRASWDSTNGRFDVEHWDGTSWDNKPISLRIALFGAGPTIDMVVSGEPTIVRNSIDSCVVRLNMRSVGNASATVDVSLFAGSRCVSLVMSALRPSTWVGGAPSWVVGTATVEAGTAITGGLRATSNDANGNRYVIASNANNSASAANGYISIGSATSGVRAAMIGCEVGGSSATSPNQAADLVIEWVNAVNANTRVVAR
jgi:hypothetical protein